MKNDENNETISTISNISNISIISPIMTSGARSVRNQEVDVRTRSVRNQDVDFYRRSQVLLSRPSDSFLHSFRRQQLFPLSL